VFVTKDRPGHLRRKGRPSRLPGKTYLGELVVDDTRTQRDYLDLAFFAPADHDTVEPDGPEAADRDAVKGAVAKLSAAGKPANIRNVRASLIGIGKDRIDTALTRLVLDGELIETEGPRRARLFTVALDQEQS
jgi:hypothetical protein